MPARLHLPATTRPALPAELLEGLSSLRVLIVDDDPKFRRTMRRGLEELGIRCAAADAADGLLSEPGARFDVILLDVMMPARSGWDFLRGAARARGPDAGHLLDRASGGRGADNDGPTARVRLR